MVADLCFGDAAVGQPLRKVLGCPLETFGGIDLFVPQPKYAVHELYVGELAVYFFYDLFHCMLSCHFYCHPFVLASDAPPTAPAGQEWSSPSLFKGVEVVIDLFADLKLTQHEGFLLLVGLHAGDLVHLVTIDDGVDNHKDALPADKVEGV